MSNDQDALAALPPEVVQQLADAVLADFFQEAPQGVSDHGIGYWLAGKDDKVADPSITVAVIDPSGARR